MQQPLLQTLHGQKLKTPPIWLMRQAGRYLPEYRELRKQAPSFIDLCLTPKLASTITLQPIHRFQFDAAILFSDILIIPYGLDQEITFLNSIGPKLNPLKTIKNLNITNCIDKIGNTFKTIELTKKELNSQTSFIGFAGAPWTVACYMIDGNSSQQFKIIQDLAHQNDPLLHDLIDLLIDVTANYLIEQIKAGIDVVQLFESWACLLPQPLYQKYVINPQIKIIDKIKKFSAKTPIICFPRGSKDLYRDFCNQVPCHGIGLDQSLSLNWALENLPPQIIFQGNLDPQTLIQGGEFLETQIDQILEAFRTKPFIFNLGHGVDKTTPIEHIDYLVNRIRTSS